MGFLIVTFLLTILFTSYHLLSSETEAIKYQSKVTFGYCGGTANAKSVLSVLGACIKCGDEIELICEGIDEQEALDGLTGAIDDGLGE